MHFTNATIVPHISACSASPYVVLHACAHTAVHKGIQASRDNFCLKCT